MAYDCFFITLEKSRSEINKYKLIREKIPNVHMVKLNDLGNLNDALTEIRKISNTEYYWIIDPDVLVPADFDWEFMPATWDNNITHTWYCSEKNEYNMSSGVKLFHKSYDVRLINNGIYHRSGEFKEYLTPLIQYDKSVNQHDVVYLSYNEKFADNNYQKLLEKVPYAKRVNGIKGIFEAHQYASTVVDTDMFYVVDADAEIVKDFNFDYYAPIWDISTVHVWKSINSVNELEYGYGGVKLFPTKLLRDATDWNIDFTTSISDSFKVMPEISNYTVIDTDAFTAWKSAFRECAKLSSNIINRSVEDDNTNRLNTWCTVGANTKYGLAVISGAHTGRDYGEKYYNNKEMLNKINDFSWIKQQFKENYSE
jgi:hypothetical protein